MVLLICNQELMILGLVHVGTAERFHESVRYFWLRLFGYGLGVGEASDSLVFAAFSLKNLGKFSRSFGVKR